MDFTKTLLLTLSLSSLLLHTTTNAISLPNFLQARVLKICKGTTDPTLCFQTILPQLRGRFNSYRALEAEILATQTQVQKTASIINALLAKATNRKELQDSLNTCKEQYSNILDSIEKAIKEVARRDVIEARFKFSALMSFHATCNDEFKTGSPSPFANDANMVYQLGGNCLDIMKAIEDRETRLHRSSGVPNLLPPAVSSPPNPCQHVIGTCNF